MQKFNRRILFGMKLIISLGMIAYLGWLIDWERARTVLATLTKLPLLMAPVFSFVALVVGALRWVVVLKKSQIQFSLFHSFRAYWLGLFYGIFLPGVLGGDAVRVGVCVRRTGAHLGATTASVLLERLVGVLTLFLGAFLVYLFFPGILSSILTLNDTRWIVLLALGGILGLGLLLSSKPLWIRWLPKDGTGGFLSFIRTGMLAVRMLNTGTLAQVILLSAVFEAMDVLATFMLGQAMGMRLPLSVFFTIMPIVYLATMIPFSLGGLGVREGVLVFLLSGFGITTSDAVTLSFLIYLNRMLIGGLAGLLQLMESLRRKNGPILTPETSEPL